MRRGLVAGVAVALLVAACSGGSGPGETSTSGAASSTTEVSTSTTADPPSTTTTEPLLGPGYGGTVTIADDQWPPTLDPLAEGGDNFIVSIIGQAWMTGAWDIDADTLEIVPDVVLEIPTVSNGGVEVGEDGTMTVTYRIRDEARWSDGTPITGDDFEFTLARNLEYESSNEWASAYTDADIVATEAGDKTFSMTTRRPTISYERLFRWLYPSHALDEAAFPPDDPYATWPGGGPFTVDTVEPFERITLVRNDEYWKTDVETGLALPFLDAVEFVFVPEAEEIVRAFRSREVDVIQPPPSVELTIQPLSDLIADGADVQVRKGQVWEHINFQFGPGRLVRSEGSCNDVIELRRAVLRAIDRDTLVSSYYGEYNEPISSYVDVFSPVLSGHAWDRYPYDPERASELYEQAVAESGRKCSAVFSTTSNGDMRVRVAEGLVPMFEQAGIPLELELMDSQLFFGEVLDEGTWDVGMWAWVASPGMSGLVDIHRVFDPGSPPPEGDNYYRWGTPDSSVRDEHTSRFAEVVVAMNTTVDDGELAALIREAESILADQAVILPLHARLTVGAVWADEVGNYRFNPTLAGHTWNIESWYRKDR
jgi:peptide/nickel transport system substrate-binding protein